MKKGKLIVLSGPSGVGKGTIRQNIEFSNYVFSVSSTTRLIRAGEKDGVDYHYLSKDVFQAKIDNNEMLEHAEFCDNFYGTDEDVVNKLLDEGKNVLLEIECQGAMQVIAKVPNALSIFILPPSLEELKRRLVNRASEPIEVIEKRLDKAKQEMLLKDNYKYNIINDNLEQVVKELDQILNEEINAKS